MTHMMMLEGKNAFLFFLSLSITLAFARMLATDRAHWNEAYYGAMIGVLAYFGGATAHQAFYWCWRHFGNGDEQWLTNVGVGVVFSTGMVMAIGAACIVRNFTVSRFGHRLWVGVLASAMIAAVFLTLLLPRH
jgi:hypothetical protein